jgi:hypothetical protein
LAERITDVSCDPDPATNTVGRGEVIATQAIQMIQMTVILLSSLKNPVGKRVTATSTEEPTLTFPINSLFLEASRRRRH